MNRPPVILAAALAVASLTALVACGDSTAPGGPFEGISFDWEGGGGHHASGLPAFSVEGALLGGEFAVAIADSLGGLVLAGFTPTDGSRGDLFILQVVERQIGELGPCAAAQGCHGRLLEGIDPENEGVVPEYWEITGGSLTIHEDGPQRVSGSVTGLALTGPDEGTTVRTVQSGSFAVPLLPAEEGAEALRCFIRRVSGLACA